MTADKAENKSIFDHYKSHHTSKSEETMSFHDYMELCKTDRMAYANAAERLLDAIGEGEKIDTASADKKLNRVFEGKTIVRYPAFEDFYDMEGTIQKIMNHLKGAAQGDEYARQVLFLYGPMGGGKTSLAERLVELLEQRPIYVLKCKNENDPQFGQLSPIHESPLGVFSSKEMQKMVAEQYDIPNRYMKKFLSPWAVKRLELAGGNPEEAFEVVKMYPDHKKQIAIAEVDPQEENTQDVTSLVGNLNIRHIDELDENDTDAYNYSGGFGKGNRGILHMDEMMKSPIKVMNPMLKAIQQGYYQGSKPIGPIPFDGIVIGSTNESEFNKFFGNPDNQAMVDRINVIHAPYTLRMDEEVKIYQKILEHSDSKDAPIAPKTLELLAKFTTMTRMVDTEQLSKYEPHIRAEVLNGDDAEGPENTVPSIRYLHDNAPLEQGMSGISTRFAFKTLTETFNSRATEGEYGADPLLMFETLERRIHADEKISADDKAKYIGFINNHLREVYMDFVGEEITEAFTNASDEMCQNIFDRYIEMASAWVDGETYNDKSVTGDVLNRAALEQRLAEIEKPAGVGNPSSFRDEVTRYVLKQRAAGEKVQWDSYEKMRQVIRKMLSRKMQDVMPVIKFDGPSLEGEQAEKRDQFLKNMEAKGYTMPMIKRAVGAYQKKFG